MLRLNADKKGSPSISSDQALHGLAWETVRFSCDCSSFIGVVIAM